MISDLMHIFNATPVMILSDAMKSKKSIRRYIGLKQIIFASAYAGLAVIAWDSYLTGTLSPAKIEHYCDNDPVIAMVLFVIIYTISVVASIPSLPLNLAAGFFWGGIIGGIYATLGMTIGGWISFITARWLIGQPLAVHFESPWISRIQSEFDKGGWKFVAYSRINPAIPSGPLNYLLGLTSLSNIGFLWVTFTFLLLPAIAIAYIGESLQTVSSQPLEVSELVRRIIFISTILSLLVGVKFAFSIYKKYRDML